MDGKQIPMFESNEHEWKSDYTELITRVHGVFAA